MYSCEICKYFTINNSNYHKHLKTVKHIQKMEKYKNFENSVSEKNHQNIPEHSKIAKKSLKTTKKITKIFQSIPGECSVKLKNGDAWNGQEERTDTYVCNFCQKQYSTIFNFNKHLKKCSDAIEESKKMQNEYLEKSSLDDEKITIESLVSRIKELEDTPRTQTNINITINAYGKENLNFISDKHIVNLLTSLNHANMIPKLVKDIHCNPAHPENMNVYKPNKKDEYVMIFDGHQWTIDDGKKVIGKMINDKVAFLDDRLYNMSNIIPHFKFEKIQEAASDNDNRKKWYGQITLDLYNNKNALITSGKETITPFATKNALITLEKETNVPFNL